MLSNSSFDARRNSDLGQVRFPARFAHFSELYGGLPVSENPLMHLLFLEPDERLTMGLQRLREHFVSEHQEIAVMPNSPAKIAKLQAQVTLGKFLIELSNGGVEFLGQLDIVDKAKRLDYTRDERVDLIRSIAHSKFPLIENHLLDITFDKTLAEEVRIAAAKALQETTVASTISVLRGYLHAPAETEIALAVGALQGTTDPAALSDLVDIAVRLSTPQAVADAAAAGVQGTSNLETLARLTLLLEDKSPSVQFRAARMLKGVKDEATIDALIADLKGDKGAEAQRAARAALEENGTPYARAAIAALLETAPHSVAMTASTLLVGIKDDISDQAHLKLLKSPDSERQLIAVKALSTRRTREIEFALAELWTRAGGPVADMIYRSFRNDSIPIREPTLEFLKYALKCDDSGLSAGSREAIQITLTLDPRKPGSPDNPDRQFP